MARGIVADSSVGGGIERGGIERGGIERGGADALRENVRRWTLVLGVLQITVGCCVGFIPPAAVAWFRGIVMAHIEFTANGVLMIALGFLVRELRLSPAALKVWFVALQIGTCGPTAGRA